MNFYAPVKNGETPVKTIVPTCRSVRILGRKYVLTPTSYKYLEIGLRVGADSCVELLLCDTKRTAIPLSIATWDALMDNRVNVERLAQAATPRMPLLRRREGHSCEDAEAERQASLPVPLHIRELTIAVVIIGTLHLVRFAITDGTAIYMAASTVLHLFDFAECINHMNFWLSQHARLVNEKFENFVRVLQRTDTTDVRDAMRAIRESTAFDSSSLVDCELLACAIDAILYAACNK